MRKLHNIKKHRLNNKRFLEIINHHIGKRDFETVVGVLNNASSFTNDPHLLDRVNGLFLGSLYCKRYFGLGENIVGTMTNMVFAGDVNIKVENVAAQKIIDDIYFDGYFISVLKRAYRYAISSYEGKSYIFFNTRQEYNAVTEVKIRDEFVDFDVVPYYEITKNKNELVRTFYKTFKAQDENETEVVYEFKYKYITDNLGNTELFISGKGENDEVLRDEVVVALLGIDTVYEYFEYIPYMEIDMESGMLPNILWIENSLAENLYWQDVDLGSSQTHTYTPDNMLYENIGLGENERAATFRDKYETQHIVKQGLDKAGIIVVPGKSAIDEIEKNLALSIIQASLDAKISPVSLGYSLIDRIASNTEVGLNRERVSIRLRENQVTMLKIYIAKIMQMVLKIEGYDLDITEIAILFDPYITPSVETTTNVLAKQVQFGLKSRKLASKELNRNELSDKEIEEEYELIKELGTQIDYNVSQRKQAEKGGSNVLKGDGVVD